MLPGSYWVVVSIQAALVLLGGVTGRIVTIRFRLVRRRDDPRRFVLWLSLWIAGTVFEVIAGAAAIASA